MEALHFYILLLGLAWSIFNKFVIPKLRNLPPTPFSTLTIIGYRLIFKQPMHKTLAHIANRHGPILLLRFGCRKVLVISSSSAAEDLFSNNDRVFANRPKMLPAKIFGCNYSTLSWAPHGTHWRHLRRVACLKVLPFHRQQDSLADETKVLLRKLFHGEKKIVELKSMFQDLVFNVMVRMFAGKRYCEKKITPEGDDAMESSLLQEYVIESFRLTTGETDAAYFMPLLKSLGLNALEERCKKLQEKGDSVASRLIEELRSRMTEFSNETCETTEEKALNFLLARQNKDDHPKNYRDDIIKGLMLGLMTAGTTTSAGTMEWAISLLIKHPKVLRKAQIEIDSYVGNDRFLEHAGIDHLPYLRCIVKETMRLYPVAPLLVPHESSKTCKVGGYNVPKGTMLMVNVWAIHNDPKIWKEPTMFSPERFEKIVDDRDGFKLMPFGYGSRSCPGKHMALRAIHFVLGSLIQCFDWEPVSQETINLTEQTGIALLKEDPLKVVCRPRSTMKKLLSQT